MTETPAQYLHHHGLRKTLGRELVLTTFLDQSRALSHGELNTLLGDQLNRASLYRVLQSFEESGIVHRVPDDEVSVKYALCSGACSSEQHHDNHVHFKCNHCGETQCLPEVKLPKVKTPDSLKVESAELLLRGYCRHCAA